MRRIILAVAIVLLAGAWTVEAQKASRREMAEKFVKAINLEKTIDQSMEGMRKRMKDRVQMMYPGSEPTEAQKTEMDNVLDVIAEEMSWERLKEDYITAYAEIFTVEEMEGIIAFYVSPAGKAFTAKQPELNEKMMDISNKMMAKVMPLIRIQRRRDRGNGQ